MGLLPSGVNKGVPAAKQALGIAKAKADGKRWGGRKVGTRIRLTEEKERLIHQLHQEGKPIAASARMVGLSRKSVYIALQQDPTE